MQDVGHNYDTFKCNSTAAVTLSLCANELSPTNGKDAEPKKQFLFGNDVIKKS